jgi:hypothetical protein
MKIPPIFPAALSNTHSVARGTDNKKSDLYCTSFDAVKIHYQIFGNGYPVLLVHDSIFDGQSWKSTSLSNDLQAAGYKIIVPDMRGNVKSDKPLMNNDTFPGI